MKSQEAPASARTDAALPTALVLLLAAGAGFAVAASYYSQPMLGVLAGAIGASTREVGFVPTLTQFGFALGIVFLAPLGDRYDRRSVILIKVGVLCAALLLAGSAPTIHVLLLASLAVGLAATTAQDMVAAGATLAPEASRGKVVGTVMTGLLLGILLSRVVSGLVAEHFGWRSMFFAAAVSVAVLGAALWRGLPRFTPTTALGYAALIGSLGTLWKLHPSLRRAAVAQGLLSLAFSAFWSTLAVMLHDEPFHLGSAAAGAFGIAGAAGALAATMAGKLADRRGPELVARLGASLVVAAFGAMLLAPMLTLTLQLVLYAATAVVFDLGVTVAQIAHQSLVYGIDPEARSRLNAVLFTGIFTGMTLGSGLAALLLAPWGWTAVVGLAILSSSTALAIRLWPARRADDTTGTRASSSR